MRKILRLFPLCLIVLFANSCAEKYSIEEKDGYQLLVNEGGKNIGYSPESGVNILTVDRYAFKDLNKNGTLDPYEDWRLDADTRAADLASKMTIEQIAGLMLYSGHQSIPGSGFRNSTYGGKKFDESGAEPSDLSDQQVEFLTNDNLRHVLLTSVESPTVAALWNNNAQRLVEGIGLGVLFTTQCERQKNSIRELTRG